MATINTKLIVPEVYAELVREKITGKCKVAQFAVTKGNLMGQAGETVMLLLIVTILQDDTRC